MSDIRALIEPPTLLRRKRAVARLRRRANGRHRRVPVEWAPTAWGGPRQIRQISSDGCIQGRACPRRGASWRSRPDSQAQGQWGYLRPYHRGEAADRLSGRTLSGCRVGCELDGRYASLKFGRLKPLASLGRRGGGARRGRAGSRRRRGRPRTPPRRGGGAPRRGRARAWPGGTHRSSSRSSRKR